MRPWELSTSASSYIMPNTPATDEWLHFLLLQAVAHSVCSLGQRSWRRVSELISLLRYRISQTRLQPINNCIPHLLQTDAWLACSLPHCILRKPRELISSSRTVHTRLQPINDCFPLWTCISCYIVADIRRDLQERSGVGAWACKTWKSCWKPYINLVIV
jgi:hypothetical protein